MKGNANDFVACLKTLPRYTREDLENCKIKLVPHAPTSNMTTKFCIVSGATMDRILELLK